MNNKRIAKELVKLAKVMTAVDVDKRFFWFANDKTLRLIVMRWTSAQGLSVNDYISTVGWANSAMMKDIRDAIKIIYQIIPAKSNVIKDSVQTDSNGVSVIGEYDIKFGSSPKSLSLIEEKQYELFDTLAADGWHR